MIELWVKTNNNGNRGDTIIEVSNMGRLKQKNGILKNSSLRQQIYFNGKFSLVYRIIAINFLPNPENKPCVDHITHYPDKFNVNDIRNLRWCTYKENNNFSEGIENKRKAKFGKHLSTEHKQHISIGNKKRTYKKGWHVKDATRQKMSESAKAGWIKRKQKNQ